VPAQGGSEENAVLKNAPQPIQNDHSSISSLNFFEQLKKFYRTRLGARGLVTPAWKQLPLTTGNIASSAPDPNPRADTTTIQETVIDAAIAVAGSIDGKTSGCQSKNRTMARRI